QTCWRRRSRISPQRSVRTERDWSFVIERGRSFWVRITAPFDIYSTYISDDPARRTPGRRPASLCPAQSAPIRTWFRGRHQEEGNSAIPFLRPTRRKRPLRTPIRKPSENRLELRLSGQTAFLKAYNSSQFGQPLPQLAIDWEDSSVDAHFFLERTPARRR